MAVPIAVNEALQRERRQRPQTQELDAPRPAAAAVGPAPEAEAAERRRFLLARLRALPIEYRVPLVLRDVEGLSNREVAALIGISLAAVKSRVHRARMQLRAELEAWEEGRFGGRS